MSSQVNLAIFDVFIHIKMHSNVCERKARTNERAHTAPIFHLVSPYGKVASR